MHAIQILHLGGPEIYKQSTYPPHAESNQALIELRAIGVNFIDVYFREGRYPTSLPSFPGQEAAGVIAVGAEVKNLSPATGGLHRRFRRVRAIPVGRRERARTHP